MLKENLSKQQFNPMNAIAGTFHTDVVVMPVQCTVTGKVTSAFYIA